MSRSAPAVTRYADADRGAWDAFVAASRNGTFLLQRGYMDYHRERFRDHSLLVSRAGRLVAVLPAHADGEVLASHRGLSYGGLVVADAMTTPLMLEVFATVLAAARAAGFRELEYKTIPAIYHRVPSEEDRYALFRHGARLSRRDVLSAVPMGTRPPLQDRRRRGAARAAKAGVRVAECRDWAGFWDLLATRLEGRYGVAPVHSLEEIRRLHGAFPDRIRLFAASDPGGLLAGTVVYDSGRVAHVQYIAGSPRGLELGALDLLFATLLDGEFAGRAWFDFGSSTEDGGRGLNRGLIEQKEGFGGRAVVHDHYLVPT